MKMVNAWNLHVFLPKWGMCVDGMENAVRGIMGLFVENENG